MKMKDEVIPPVVARSKGPMAGMKVKEGRS